MLACFGKVMKGVGLVMGERRRFPLCDRELFFVGEELTECGSDLLGRASAFFPALWWKAGKRLVLFWASAGLDFELHSIGLADQCGPLTEVGQASFSIHCPPCSS